jgi:hypothetical protein
VFSVCMVAQPVMKMMPQAANIRIRLNSLILVFMVCCVSTLATGK